MPSPRVDFAQTYEGMFVKGLGDDLTPRLRQRLREQGLDLDHMLPGYPAEKFPVYLRIATEEIFPQLPEEAAQLEMGKRFLHGYVQTFIGKAMALMMRAVGPMRTLSRMERNFRSGNNYIETKLTEVNPHEAQLWMNEVHGAPSFFAGVMTAGAELIGTRNAKVEVIARAGAGATFRVSWDER